MEHGDIGIDVHQHVACMFEGLLITIEPEPVERERRFFKKKEEDLSEDEYVNRAVRRWKANELPLKSVIHMTTKLGIGVEVYTYLDPIFKEPAEHWLARKGAAVQVFAYYDLNELRDDFRYNRDVHTFFTPSQDDAAMLGLRATVVNSEGVFGF